MKIRKKSYKIKSKLKFTTSITVTIIVFVFMVNTVLGINAVSSLTKHEMIEVEIESGDTLWDIASEYGAHSTDLRTTIYEICTLNDISADSIYPGQIILVPNYIQ